MFGKKNKKSVWDRFPELKSVEKDRFPNHLLITPDGNGRWAKLYKKNVVLGHKAGAEVIKTMLRDLEDLPIKFITIWGFSADNWKRTPEETDGIMSVIDKTVRDMLPEVKEKNIRIAHIGRSDRIPKYLKKTLSEAIKETEKNTGKILSLAVDFSGQDQETRVMKKLIARKTKKITMELLWKLRDTGGLVRSADLIIRTSGEKRASDLGWLATNSELYFIEKLLPNAGTGDIVKGIIDFSKRKRRFGGRPSFAGRISSKSKATAGKPS